MTIEYLIAYTVLYTVLYKSIHAFLKSTYTLPNVLGAFFARPMLQSPILVPLFTQYLCLYFIHATYCASWPYGLCSGVVQEFFRDCGKRFCICTYKIRRDRELVLERTLNYQYLAVCVCLRANGSWITRREEWDQRKDMRRRVIMVVLASTLYRKFETYIHKNKTAWPRSQFLPSCIWQRFIYSHKLYFPVWDERSLSSTAGAERRAGNCRQAVVGCSSLPSPPLLRLSREFT